MFQPTTPSNQDKDSPDVERQLVEAAIKDSQALSTLYRQHYAAIYGYVLRRVGNSHDANDIVAEVFVSMVRYLPRFRWTGVPFRCWLLRIAISQISRWVRKKKWSRLWAPMDESISKTEVKAEDERQEQVRRALAQLPSRLRIVLELHYVEGLTVESISQVLNCREGTVKSRLSRGREAIRIIISKSEERTKHEQRTVGTVFKKLEV